MQTPVSLLSPLGYDKKICGYCKGASECCSYYAITQGLQPEFYQGLLDRGWRRSDQRQVVNRFNKYILGDIYIQKKPPDYIPDHGSKPRNVTRILIFWKEFTRAKKSKFKLLQTQLILLTVTLETDDFTEEKYALFANYQRTVHHQPPNRISKHGFKNFLCSSSPLPRSTSSIDGKTKHIGSYHQCYRLDGKLIAIGVLDLLPQCVSAVYFMYHESVHSHAFGKLGALREIALAKEQGYQYWYAGFYIHDCVKMRYKGDYSPQYILDPETYHWVLLDGALRAKLDERKFVSEKHDLESNTPSQDPDSKSKSKSESESESSATKRIPIFERSMPGLLSAADLLTNSPLDKIKIRIGDTYHETNEFITWENQKVTDVGSLKGIISELVSAVGSRLAGEMVVYLH
ncbi:hypothetical protein EYC84_011033 [Monilinia fructicola]|uniref:Arginyl-tRNA--protein transferase 1 n=1 Tax=Monilinia fructicola TaxID=38448 RepID=A0A5M9J812_MONFR|nr:hypothetical protein EYC84_011033 [Monilinia fructicola]